MKRGKWKVERVCCAVPPFDSAQGDTASLRLYSFTPLRFYPFTSLRQGTRDWFSSRMHLFVFSLETLRPTSLRTHSRENTRMKILLASLSLAVLLAACGKKMSDSEIMAAAQQAYDAKKVDIHRQHPGNAGS